MPNMPTFGPPHIGGSGDRTRSGRTGPAGSESAAQSKQSKKAAWKLLPDVWALMKPRGGILAFGFLLMLINRLAGLVAPGSLKYLFDGVIGKHNAGLLKPLVAAVVGATLIQGLTSYVLTQLLSKSSQRMITELRVKVQAHIGRLPVAYYDANKTGVLVSRIMSDVEGIRNLVGTGLVDFVGGVMTAVIALAYLLRVSVSMTLAAFVAVLIF